MKNKPVIKSVEISNPNRIIYKKENITKLDVARYYNHVSKRMLRYCSYRLLSSIRCHDGLDSCFFKKHPNENDLDSLVKKIKNSKGETLSYFYIEDTEGLIKEAQNGTLEFHIWGSKYDNINKPDMMVFDLDPDTDIDISKVKQGALDLKLILDKLKLKSFLKTSGNKGYHIVVPFTPNCSYQKFKEFSKKVAQIMEDTWPDRYTTNIRKKNRKGKIFIDWMRNIKGATFVAPYSLRAKDNASISFPIAWKDLDKINPNSITIKNYKEFYKKDPWKHFYDYKQKIL